MQICPNCQKKNSDTRVRCENCNAKLSFNEGYTCPNCKSEIGPFSDQCRNCGTKISKEYKAMKSNVVEFPKASERNKRAKAKKTASLKKKRVMKDKKSIIILTVFILLAILGIYDLYIK